LVYNQREIDNYLIEMDGTDDKSRLGANITIATSIASAKAGAMSSGLPLYRYTGGVGSYILPAPMFNIINGGEHADNNLDIQEYMIVPDGMPTFSDALRAGSEIYHRLKKNLEKSGHLTSVGDEGGFAPDLASNEEALVFLIDAIADAGYSPGEDVNITLDVAGSEFFEDGYYFFRSENKKMKSDELISIYEEWIEKYPVVSIEDGLSEDDWDGWVNLTRKLGDKVQIVGDDLFVTNISRIRKGVEEGAGNAVLIKPNQIGTLSETIDAVNFARRNRYNCVLSHRSGETEDSFIADFAVGMNILQIKSGAPCRGERVMKYNRLLRIEEDLGIDGEFAGPGLYKF
jgi:enolase